VGIGGLRTYARALGHDIDVSQMFRPLAEGAVRLVASDKRER
jgi:hypothetical protein